MNLKLKVKAGGITNLTDARFFAAWGVEWLGFSLEETAKNTAINPEKAKEIIGWIEGPKIVGEFADTTPARSINHLADYLNLDFIQLPAQRLLTEEFTKPVIAEIVFDPQNPAPPEGITAEWFLIKFHPTDLENLTDRQYQLQHYQEKFNLILDIPLALADPEKLLALHPHALQLSSGTEEKTGLRDFDELSELLEKLTIQD